MTEAQVISNIDTQVFSNGIKAITGNILNSVLKNMYQSTENRLMPTIPAITPADNTPIGTGGITILQSLVRLQAQINSSGAYSLTTNYIPQWNGTTFIDSWISGSASTPKFSTTDLITFEDLGGGIVTTGFKLGKKYIQFEDNSDFLEIGWGSPSTINRQAMSFSQNSIDVLSLGTFAPSFQGIKYGANYGANFTARSLVDKQFVDTAIATAVAGLSGWGLTGNAGINPAINFIGTTDATDLVFRTNSTERARILGSNGRFGINTSTPSQQLHVVGNGLFRNGSNTFLDLTSAASGGQSQVQVSNDFTGNLVLMNASTNYAWNILKSANGSFTAYYSTGSISDPNQSDLKVGSQNSYIQYMYFRSTLKFVDVVNGDRLNIDASGNFGFGGAVNPTSRFDILSPFTGYTGSIFKLRLTANNPILNITTTSGTGLNVVNWEAYTYDILVAGASAYYKVKSNNFQQYFQLDAGNSSISTKTFAGGTAYNAGLQNYYEFSGTVVQTTKSNTYVEVANTGGTFVDSLEGIRVAKGTWTNTLAVFRPFVTNGGWSGFGTLVPTATIHIIGSTSNSTDSSIKVENTSSVSLFSIRNDGYSTINGLTIGKGLSQLASNVAFGVSALDSNTTGFNNFAFGFETLLTNTTGQNNVGIGHNVLRLNLAGNDNVGIGSQALAVSLGNQNTAIGAFSLLALTSGIQNTAIGYRAGANITIGEYNTIVGNDTGATLTTGNFNTIIGRDTARDISTGSRNTIVGASVTGLTAALSDTIILATGGGVIRYFSNSSGFTGIGGILTPNSTLHVAGQMSQPVTLTGAASVTVTEAMGVIVCNNAATAITVTLPTPVGFTGKYITVSRSTASTGVITVAGAAGTIEALNGTMGATTSLATIGLIGAKVTFMSNGTNWLRRQNG